MSTTADRPAFDCPASAALFERSRQSLAMGVASGMRRAGAPQPLFFERGEGPYFFDADGHRLLDYTLAWGPLILGNSHPAVIAAVTDQLARGFAFGAQHRGEIELAELVTSVVPGVERVIFSNTGSEAVQAALRLARSFTGRPLFIKFEGHYHGWFNNVLVSYRPKSGDPIEPLATCGGQPRHEFADTLVLPWNDAAALADAFARHGDRIAAVLTEPLLANSGSVEPASGYLQAVIDLCRRHGAVSIFDEVITGFRLALGGAGSTTTCGPTSRSTPRPSPAASRCRLSAGAANSSTSSTTGARSMPAPTTATRSTWPPPSPRSARSRSGNVPADARPWPRPAPPGSNRRQPPGASRS